ncbi:MAG: preprotein translocase subunit YajC [Gemmatimonadaceae bacterium]
MTTASPAAVFPTLAALFQFPGSSNPMVGTLVMYVAIFAIFWFVIFRPQQKQRKQHEEAIRQIKRGDEVVTAGGIVGEVVHIRQVKPDAPSAEDRVTIKSGESRLVVERGRIARLAASPASAAAPPSA